MALLRLAPVAIGLPSRLRRPSEVVTAWWDDGGGSLGASRRAFWQLQARGVVAMCGWSIGDDGSLVVLPAGFPACRRCPYLGQGAVDVCLACCTSRLPAPNGHPCPVCDQALGSATTCANDWCSRGDRWFSLVWSIAPHAGSWRRVIGDYKYRRQIGWAQVLGQVLLGYLDEHMPWFDDYDVLVPMPAYTGPGARRAWDHVGEFVTVAARLAGPRWEFCSGLIVKDCETPALAGLTRTVRRACAEGTLRRSLRVPNPAAVAGCRVVVIDDVFTEGSTLREVARTLLLAGADEVAGVTLARQPWLGGAPRR